MKSDERLFLGIDVGTSGVRAMAVTETGGAAASASVGFAAETIAPQPGRHEQSSQAWWQAVEQAVGATIEELARKQGVRERLAGVAVDGTSGTLIALDRAGRPLRPAIMYNDPRAGTEADALNAAAGDCCRKLGYRFNASFALAKIAWLRSHEPEVFAGAARFVHQADYIVEQLTGGPAASDYSNALKTGYDLSEECWPAWIEQHLGIVDRLPRVVAPGTIIGTISTKAAEQTGLPEGLPVVAGATDGTAAFLASGARRPGDCNTTLGTTLVFKGVSRRLCSDSAGLIYCHKLPGGWWLPGAASNVGTDWIAAMFPDVDVRAMDAAAAARLPWDGLCYPLVRAGERFPFLAPKATGFFLPEPADATDRYAACLQGLAMVERLGYGVLDAVADGGAGEVFSTGGGSRSDVWMQCRADATGRLLHRPAYGESAFGAAVLAAAGTYYNGIAEAVERMVRIDRTFSPEPARTLVYDGLFERFRNELKKRGYL